MPGTKDEGFPLVPADFQTSPLRPDDEREAASVAGLCDEFLRESGFSLIQVGSDFAVYRNESGYQVTIRGHRWFCKLSSGAELSGVGFVDLSDAIRGG
jgi:hypothetical protein